MSVKLVAMYIGGCNAENVSNRLLDSRISSKIYRVPTACMSREPIDVNPMSICKAYDRIWKRLSYEAKREYSKVIINEEVDMIVIDFWRDCYVDLIKISGEYVSLSLEMQENKEIYDNILHSCQIVKAGTTEHYEAFLKGLDFLVNLLETHRPHAKIALLDCPPVRMSKRQDTMTTLEAKYDIPKWEKFCERYKWALTLHKARLANSFIVSFGPNLHTAPDAPWGEGAIHYAPYIYDRIAAEVSGKISKEHKQFTPEMNYFN